MNSSMDSDSGGTSASKGTLKAGIGAMDPPPLSPAASAVGTGPSSPGGSSYVSDAGAVTIEEPEEDTAAGNGTPQKAPGTASPGTSATGTTNSTSAGQSPSATGATSPATTSPAATVAEAGPGRFFVGRKFPGRGRGRSAGGAAAGARGGGRGRGADTAGRGGGPAAAAGRGSAGTTPPVRPGGILKVKESVIPELARAGSGGGGVSALAGGQSAVAVADGMAAAAAAAAVEGRETGVSPSSTPSSTTTAVVDILGAASGVTGAAGLGSGPPPIVSLDEMARADAAEKKRKRKARPAGKKVGWADRVGRTLQVVKEFHSEDVALAVSDTPQESPAEAAASMAAAHQHHKQWAERVKREREMERKFHDKSGSGGSSAGGPGKRGSSKGKGRGAGEGEGGEDSGSSNSRKKPMVPTTAWRRPGPYQEGVVHEDVLMLEVESSEAESQGARTRAGLEQV